MINTECQYNSRDIAKFNNNKPINENNCISNPLIIMDERERGKIREIFETFPANIQIETLPIGDYLIFTDYIIERKRGDDLVSSIFDNRLFDQLDRIKCNCSHPLVILEDPDRMFDRNGVLTQSIYGALMYIIHKHHVQILPTCSEFETAQTIWSMAKYLQNNENFHYIPFELSEVSISRQIQLDFLQGLIGISEKKAISLLDCFETPGNIIKTIQQVAPRNKDLISLAMHNEIIKKSNDLRGFGIKFWKRNKLLLSLPFEEAKKIRKTDFMKL